MKDSLDGPPAKTAATAAASTAWANAIAARRTIVGSARRCIVSAISSRLPDDASPGELYASDETFRQLSNCISEYAHAIGSLGDGTESGLGLILAAVTEAAAPYEPHPALMRAVEQWYREALETIPNTRTD